MLVIKGTLIPYDGKHQLGSIVVQLTNLGGYDIPIARKLFPISETKTLDKSV